MKKILITKELELPEIVLGCMRIHQLERAQQIALIHTAVELGINLFDHADIYGKGSCERLFGEAFSETGLKREQIFLQSKCGIQSGYYNLSKAHILASAEQSLQKLQTDYLDILLLHRPDALCEPEEIAEAFEILHSSGKVKAFGLSNHSPMQIKLLKKYVTQPLVINQLQFSIAHAQMVASGINVNTTFPTANDRDGSVLDYCRLHDITIQPWSPFQFGFIEGVFIGNEQYPQLNSLLTRVAEEYQISVTTLAIAWILRHPAHMQPVVGTTSCARLQEIAKATQVTLSRESWYEIYCAAGNNLP